MYSNIDVTNTPLLDFKHSELRKSKLDIWRVSTMCMYGATFAFSNKMVLFEYFISEGTEAQCTRGLHQGFSSG